MTYGVTDDGFVTKPLETIIAEIKQDLLDDISSSLDLSAETPLGQIIAIIGEPLSELWEVAEAIYSSFDPDTSVSAALDNLCALTGVTRLPADYSEVSVICTGTPLTDLDAGQVLGMDGSSTRFETTEDTVIAASDAWAAGTAYVIGDIVTNNSNIYYCSAGGTSAGSGGPTTTSTAITDNTVTWRYIGAGTGHVEATFRAQETGPILANAWTLTEIETPVSGWEAAANPLDADLGRDEESDSELRIRREQSIAIAGTGTVEAIQADIRALDDVVSCTVFENTTDSTNSDGLPPHSIEVLVLDGDDDEIAQVIWDTKPAGIETYGSSSGTAIDENGDSQTMEFSRPSEKTIYVTVDVTTDSDYPTDGDTQIKNALVAFGKALGSGADVVRSALFAPCFDVLGVVDVTNIKLGFSSTPSGTSNLTIDDREISTWDTSRIVVNAT